MLPNRFFSQCLVHTMARKGDEVDHTYILPFSMDLDETEFKELGNRLCAATGFSKVRYRKEIIERLKSPSLTQRLTKATLTRAPSGNWCLMSKTSAQYGLVEGQFSVLSPVPCFTD